MSRKKKRSSGGAAAEEITIPLTTTPPRQVPAVNKGILRDFKKTHSAQSIRQCAARNGEKPFGYVLDYIKDMYGLTKSEGWDTAQAVCRFFKV